ncbi:hypothetical protein [Flavobacterium anhuiense]|uniref:hypothetical protein n=1 Tax=Flavobacterium anhuiense TaxID=459526 RepID=UPI000E6BF2C9|nr:hypothetical protein [Flavobacterium anhuiense]
MIFNFAKQISSTELLDKNFDLFIMSISHEERYDHLLKNYDLCYDRLAVLSYDKTHKLPIDKIKVDTSFYLVGEHKFVDVVIDLLDNELSSFGDDQDINILVDYSCMTKTYYYTIMSYFVSKDLKYKNVKIYFSYTPSEYVEPKNPKYNAVIEPIPGRFSMPSANKPKALIVGLGYESKKAEGIIEYLDPKITYAMYSKPTLDERFSEAIEENNKGLLDRLKNHTLTFPVDDLLNIERILTTLYFSLNEDYNIVIAPLGPKPFTFVSMLMSLKYSDIDVWRVHSASDFNRYSRKPLEGSELVICEVDYSN